MPKRGGKKTKTSLSSKIASDLLRLGRRRYGVEGPSVAIGKTGMEATLTWKTGDVVAIAFFVCVDDGVGGAMTAIKAAQRLWRCKVLLVRKSLGDCTNSLWLADLHGIADFHAVAYSELGKAFARNKILRKWLGV